MKFFAIVRDGEHGRHLNANCEKAIRNSRRVGIDDFTGGELIPGAENYRPLNHALAQFPSSETLLISKKRNNTKLCRVGERKGRPSIRRDWLHDRRDLGLRRGAKLDKKNILLVIEKRLQGRLDQVLGREVNAQGIDVLL